MKLRPLTIGRHRVGYGEPVFVIAEAGVNHNGRLDLALKLVDAAADAGADAIKFQTFRAEDVVTSGGRMASYQKKNLGTSESQVDMLRKLELNEKYYTPIMRRCRDRKILFLSTPHGGIRSVDFLRRLKVPAYKLGSGDLTNAPLLSYIGALGKPMILGTGMATMADVKNAIRWIRAGGTRDIVMLHCTTNYPCPDAEVNLRVMQTMMRELDVLVGYSDHTPENQVAVMAATMGACVIEKHFTLSRKLKGPDHVASLEPHELAEMIRAVRRVPVIMGSAVKRPNASERPIMTVARKSLVTIRPVKKGERFTANVLGVKRPGSGMPPAAFKTVIGKRAKRDLPADTILKRTDIG